MNVNEIFEDTKAVTGETTIYIIRDNVVVSNGNWYQDNIIKYHDKEISGYSVNLEKNKVYIVLKGK